MKRSLIIGTAVLITVCSLLASFVREQPLILMPFGFAFQLTTVLFALLPVLGLAWFAWHLFFRRRVRLLRLRRIRVRQGRTNNLLAPPPVFGAAYKRTDDESHRNRPE